SAVRRRDADLWDVRTGRPFGSPFPHPEASLAASFGLDGQTVSIIAQDGGIGLWSAPTGRPIRSLSGLARTLSRAVFSPDRRTVLMASRGEPVVMLRDIQTGRVLTLPTAHRGDVTTLAISPNGKVALS